MTIKGIIFDFDGLIVDTESPELKAWEDFFRGYDLEFPIHEYCKNIGHTFDDAMPLNFLQSKLGIQLNEQEAYTEFKQRKLALMDQEPLCDGVLDYLKEAKEMDIKIGLASSAIREWVDYHLDKHNISDYFDCIKTREDVENPKPEPDLFATAVACIDIQPREAIAFEDSYNGIISAKKAGLFAVAVPNNVTINSDFSQADLVISRLSDISLAHLIERFN